MTSVTEKIHMENNEVLLMTASINHPSDMLISVINDPKDRLLQYLVSLIAWIKLTSINTLIFCENSGTNYNFRKIIEYAKSEGKILEPLVFSGNRYTHKYGKGYGEGEIIEYAIKNSAYLDASTNFYKITGRTFIPEFDRIQQLHAHLPNVFDTVAFLPDDHPFLKLDRPVETTAQQMREILRFLYVYFGRGRGRGPHKYHQMILTLFYKSNVGFFKENLIRSYKRVNDQKSYFLEHIFYQDLMKQEFSPFLCSYSIVGKSGGTGRPYSTYINQLLSQNLVDRSKVNSHAIINQDYSEDIKAIAKSFL